MLSIVVPVYNAEKELGECLDRILAQKGADFELILINDGSTDNSMDVVNAYAAKDNRIRVFSQENQGITTTRKNAVMHAEGDYIWFIDDDDLLEDGIFARAEKELADRPDILWFGYTVDFIEENFSFKTTLPDTVYTSPLDAVHAFFANDSFNMYWNKLYRTALLKDHPEAFPHRKDQSGDLIFNCVAFAHAEKIKASSQIAYHYIKRSKETMVTRFLKDSEVILADKENGVRMMMSALNASNDPLIDNYLLREYEVFVINLFADNCPYSTKEKKELVRKYVLNEEARASIRKGTPVNAYSRIFKFVAGTGNAGMIISAYSVFSFIKNHMGAIYKAFRRSTYKDN